jgi:hypothetical protein
VSWVKSAVGRDTYINPLQTYAAHDVVAVTLLLVPLLSLFFVNLQSRSRVTDTSLKETSTTHLDRVAFSIDHFISITGLPELL